MKINSIVTNYKNLSGGEISLDAKFINLLVGQNGLGKSNLLEVVAKAFADLYSLGLGWKPDMKLSGVNYTIDYECYGNHILATNKNDQLAVFRYDEAGRPLRITVEEFKEKHDRYLPSQIFIYYSGENKRIRDTYKYFFQHEGRSRRLSYSKGKVIENTRHITTLSNDQSLYILLTLLVYRHDVTYSKAIDSILNDVLGIEVNEKIIFSIQSPRTAKINQLDRDLRLFDDDVSRMSSIRDVEASNAFWGVKGNLSTFLNILVRWRINTYGGVGTKINAKQDREIFDFEEIDLSEGFCQRLYEHFPHPMDFFNMLMIMNDLGMIRHLEFSVSKRTGSHDQFTFNHLSEGEQQYITIMGMTAMNREDNSEILYLLDEPDTHVNPNWQREFVGNIENLVDDDSKKKKSFIISTHSPFLVQAYNERNVSMLLFRKGDDGNIVIDKDNHTITNWRIDQVVLSPYFNLASSRPSSLDSFVRRRNEIVDKGNLSEADVRYLRSIANEEGFLPTGESLHDIETMVEIHCLASELKKKMYNETHRQA